MNILITAPNSHVGRKVIPELLAPEFSVRVIARDTSCLPQQILERVEVVRGSMDDFATLRQALDGVEALLWCVPPESLQEANVRAHYERFARTGCRAIREAGTARVVTISVVGNSRGRCACPISAARAMEVMLNQSGAAVRHLRCGWLMENFLRRSLRICGHGVLSYPVPGHIPLPIVAARDVAEVALHQLVRRDWTGVRAVSISGPGDLSFSQAASTLERVLNRPVSYTEVSADAFTQELVRSGTSIHYARSMIEMFATWVLESPREQMPATELIGPTSLAEWTKRELLPLMPEFGPQRWLHPIRADLGKADPKTSSAPHGL